MKDLNADFWNNRYESGETGWDIGRVSPAISEYIDQLENTGLRILIPGCGNSYEAEYLADKGFSSITLIDISDKLTESLRRKFETRQFVNVITQDFFEHDGQYDIIIEQTFFCALHPTKRNDYAEKMRDLLSEEGKLVGVLFDKGFEKEGPPFGGSADEYRKIFESHFDVKVIDRCYNSIPPRSGGEVFIILRKKTK
ncbi:MAG: methyltransferase domain-containing protein [Ignavibacteria bacterium]|nr:methyltransferase domain-containing protein [Ignavibacteria bacterium]